MGGSSTWFLGIGMILISGFFAAVGFLVSKISSVYEDSKPRTQRVNNIFKRPLTWVGIFTSFLIPAPLDLAALVFARFSLLAPFASLCLVFNLIGAHLLLDERVGWLEIMSTLMIVSGCAVTTLFGAKDDVIFSLTRCPNEEIIMTNATCVRACVCVCVCVYMCVCMPFM